MLVYQRVIAERRLMISSWQTSDWDRAGQSSYMQSCAFYKGNLMIGWLLVGCWTDKLIHFVNLTHWLINHSNNQCKNKLTSILTHLGSDRIIFNESSGRPGFCGLGEKRSKCLSETSKCKIHQDPDLEPEHHPPNYQCLNNNMNKTNTACSSFLGHFGT